MGFSLITIRDDNRGIADKYPRGYAEKLLYLKEGQNALKRGDQNVQFVDGSTVYSQVEQLGIAADSCKVDGIHPNDLDFACMANTFGIAISRMI